MTGAGAATVPGEGERLARAFLSAVVEPGDALVGRWLREFRAVEVRGMLAGTVPVPRGASARRLAGYRARAERADPAADLDVVEAVGGRLVCPGDAEWPRQLDDLGDERPIALWVRGRASLRMWALRSVAVVGARACTDYGRHVAARLAGGLAEAGWTVVSGAAYGVDGAAHRGAFAERGATVGVLACGVDVAYPRGHAALIRRIAEDGLLVAELPPGAHPTRSRFVQRNRVIAALTRGTVVVEAEYRSGSLVTARRAERLGRSTMGVPGPVTSGLSAGVHELLRGGAVLVSDAADVVELVGSIGELAPERRGPVLARDLLDPVTARVLEAMPASETMDLDGVARGAGTAPDDAWRGLCSLQALGYVERLGERWRLVQLPRGPGRSRRGDP